MQDTSLKQRELSLTEMPYGQQMDVHQSPASFRMLLWTEL